MAKKEKKIHNLFQSVTARLQVALQLFVLQLVTLLNITFRQGEEKKQTTVLRTFKTLPKSCLTH